MRFATLGSGSAGNAILVQHGATAVIIDCGLSARQVERRAAAIGFNIDALDAILITHEHDDHVAGAAALARRCGATVYTTHGTQRGAGDRFNKLPKLTIFEPEQPLNIGTLEVTPVIVPHDAREPCQFVLRAGDQRLGVLTDVGQITPHLERCYRELDGLVLEFNHDPELLAASPYPPALKTRIGGQYGHLSNLQAAQLLRRINTQSLRHFIAAHLSEKTNTRAHVEAHLRQSLPARLSWHIAAQSEPSPWFDLGC